jgi:hypothetical protein
MTENCSKIVTGWPRLGNADALAQGLDAIGIRKEKLNDDAGKLAAESRARDYVRKFSDIADARVQEPAAE